MVEIGLVSLMGNNWAGRNKISEIFEISTLLKVLVEGFVLLLTIRN